MNSGEQSEEPAPTNAESKVSRQRDIPAKPGTARSSPKPERSLADLAWAEWETIQKKIDNVSTFPFTIKTWTVAVAGAFLGLGKGFDFPPQALYAASAIPILFWTIESKHHRVRGILSRRAGQLEALIDILTPFRSNEIAAKHPSLVKAVGRVPGVALAIHRAKRELERQVVTIGPPPASRDSSG